MDFRFVHAADLHLGSPFKGLSARDETAAKRFSSATREALGELVSQTIATRAACLLIAGDIYDGEWRDASVGLFFNREMARLARENIPVFLVRGNHDAESEVTRVAPLPDNVHVFSARRAETVRIDALKLAVHGRSFRDRATTENLALDYPAPVPGYFNIGLLHTSCEGAGGHVVYAPCSVSQLAAHGYDYWALGHVHERRVLNRDPWIVWSGALQGRNIRECGPKGALLVEVRAGVAGEPAGLDVDRARWAHARIELSPDEAESESALAARAAAALAPDLAAAQGRPTAFRVTLAGTTPLHGALQARRRDLAEAIEGLVQHAHADAWLEKLDLRTSPPPPAPAARAPEGGLDPAALLAGAQDDEELRARVQSFLDSARKRLPGGEDDSLRDLDRILADARALALSRLTAP